jgi:IS5 family transposase
MECVCPWASWIAVIDPWYFRGTRGRPPIGVARMLRMYCVQQWFGLSDELVEDAIYDSQALRHFVGIDLSRESVPDATTLLKFRRLLEDNKLTQAMFEETKNLLSAQGLLMRQGTLVDATIIAAPASTKNKDHARDPEMHQTKKGNEWHFGMKAHIGAHAESGVVHSLHTTAANESDVAHAHQVLHGQETRVHMDAGYTGVQKRDEIIQAQQRGEIRTDIEWQVASKRGKIKHMPEGALQGPGQEHGAIVQPVRLGQSGDRQEQNSGAPGPRCVLNTTKRPERARKLTSEAFKTTPND